MVGTKNLWIPFDRAAVESCWRLPAKAYGGETMEKTICTGRIQEGRAPVVRSMPDEDTWYQEG